MGTPVAVSHHTGQLRRGLLPAAELCEARLRTLNIKTLSFLPRAKTALSGG